MSREAELREQVKEMGEVLERLGQAAMRVGTVVAEDGEDRFFVNVQGQGSLSVLREKKTKVGNSVVLAESGQIWKPVRAPALGGVDAVISVSDKGVEVGGLGGGTRLVCPGDVKGLDRGDRVILDPTGSIVVALVEKAPPLDFTPMVDPVHWDDVGGCGVAKDLLRLAIEAPRKNPEIFKRYKKRPTRGVLMWGPPGCGKTMLAKAVATSVGATTGGFISVKGPEVLDPYVGVTEATIRSLFKRAKEYQQKNGQPAVIFIDEAESLLGRRGTNHGNPLDRTIVPTFLSEMDGLESTSAIVILATNREDMLDPAIVRDGRIDFKVEIERPDQKVAADIIRIHLRGLPLAKGITADQVAQVATDMLFDENIVKLRIPYSGALLAGVVDKATSNSINRELGGERKTGIDMTDVFAAIKRVCEQEAPRKAA